MRKSVGPPLRDLLSILTTHVVTFATYVFKLPVFKTYAAKFTTRGLLFFPESVVNL